jgi:PilZ domain-containing protein
MLQVLSGLLVVLWFLCWINGVRSVHIHVLLVLAATLFIAHLATLRRSKPQFERARRVAIQSPIRFRKLGDAEWHSGMTENVSQTGVLFTAGRVFRLNTRVEMTFEVPEAILGITGPLKCEGCIVRAAVSPFGDSAHLAAKILACEPVRPQ